MTQPVPRRCNLPVYYLSPLHIRKYTQMRMEILSCELAYLILLIGQDFNTNTYRYANVKKNS